SECVDNACSEMIAECCLQNDSPGRRQHRFQMRQQNVQSSSMRNQSQAENKIETRMSRPEIEHVRVNEFKVHVRDLRSEKLPCALQHSLGNIDHGRVLEPAGF